LLFWSGLGVSSSMVSSLPESLIPSSI
jgi:hypothetical protein